MMLIIYNLFISASNYNGHVSEHHMEENVPNSIIKNDQNEKSTKSHKPSRDDKKHKHMNGSHSGSKRKYQSSEVCFKTFF